MPNQKLYENYPPLTVAISSLVSLLIYLLGGLILSDFGVLTVILFILYCLAFEIRLLKYSCVNCYYYGKLCFSGKGMLCSFFFKKGDPGKFACKQVTGVQLIPDLLIVLIPFLAGIYLSIVDFSWLRLGEILLLVILGFPVIGYLRGNLACLFCKQRELGCPAEKLFGKSKA